ncbi:MAG: ShlB/FhaC/HecB family hemolysin secretion/activation protein [Pseudodesulfovibrio sp.]|uniref:Hemolysin activator HlyB domain protein n=1 Tax=Pseudodesulfovibrio aespoeensis (strain ATCC 700646 / DSM 10631 / Aspo-2) TaxID=643562 RepID=E6VYY5_PSEA9|nr:MULTISPECIES: ShlB/FhaC/HecB family hemolysin secretion/activation protein [Pseudodesulfovibrio]MBU4474072.1 ShlB/FhaC/HecB family hemolysin secretion/activation protein [Pseudomonadota bacterium]ADU61648.1 Hemolysin activator HlyB domain protein [Pseudodesulfovibrio aespoeensis Aspo-2]MBU4517761.1 ShlB/FhaC/HecB family hemolysin secretion/activation protein [Pseudomonadota bacterium]MBU4522193.1 ShlB/FhaC/HecB family hemolysin secretion/activation protein [Pseudomonadota bacterium]MBU45590
MITFFPFALRRLPHDIFVATLLTWSLLLLTVPAHAATPAEIDAANREAQRIQNEQQERMQQQLLKDSNRGTQTTPYALPEVQAPSLQKSGVCRDIQEIVLNGVTLLPESVKNSLTAPYLNKCLYVEDIEKLLGEILKAYIDRGYIAVRPYVQAQDLNKGRLEILIVEGKVERLILKDGDKKSVNLTTAFPFIPGEPLNLRDIEQGLDQVNRLQSNSATMEISPGEEAGASVVTITNTPSFPLSISGTIDNLGGLSTGRHQGSVTAGLDHPLSLNDYLNYTHKNTLFEDAEFHDSDSDSLYYSLPFGYYGVQLFYSNSSYRSPVKTSTKTLVARGTNETFRGELDWVAYRDQNQKLSTLIAINTKNSKNYLDGEFLQVSSRKLTIVDVDANWFSRFPGFIVNGGIGWSKGLTDFGALKDVDGAPTSSPQAQGSKFRYSGGVTVPFDVMGQGMTFSSQLSGQFALVPLYGSEQLTVGSFYTVRGFNRNSLSGDRALYVRNEITTSLPTIPFIGITPRPFIGFDMGRIEQFKTTNDAELSGAALGIRFAGKYVSGELSAAKSIAVPTAIEREPVQFSATMTVSF